MRLRTILPAITIVFVLFGLVWADSTPKKSDGKTKAAEKEKVEKTKIEWLEYDEGLALAKKEGKKVFVEFTAKWCGWCKKMHASTFIDPTIVGLFSDNYIAVSIDGDSRDTLNIEGYITSERQIARQYKVSSYPTYWFLTPEAEPIAPVKGYRDAKALGQILDYLKDDLYKTKSFQDYITDKSGGK